MKDSFCSYCGTKQDDLIYPKLCATCNQITYLNPLPVGVAVVPIIEGGLLMIRRNIDPQKGKIGFPSGFIESHETWQEGLAREVLEETGVVISLKPIKILQIKSSPNYKNLLIFAQTSPISLTSINLDFKNEETQEVLVREILDEEMAFPLHLEIYKKILKSV